MRIGAIVRYQGQLWRVALGDQQARTDILESWEGVRVEVPNDLDSLPDNPCEVVGHPSDWPFIAASAKSREGPIVAVLRDQKELTPLLDWVPSDRYRAGGSIFFNPGLRIRRGEVLVAVHKSGARTRLNAGQKFGSINQRQRTRTRMLKKQPKSRFERLLEGSFDSDE